MFSIQINMPEIKLTGLEALDARRILGLKDDSKFYLRDCVLLEAEVPESFARRHFSDRKAILCAREVHFCKGDLVDCENNGVGKDGFVKANNLSKERIIELWLDAKPG